MTHDELLAKVQASRDEYNYVAPHNALRAVVELHKQIDDNSCHHCATWYPCLTIQAIEKELA